MMCRLVNFDGFLRILGLWDMPLPLFSSGRFLFFLLCSASLCPSLQAIGREGWQRREERVSERERAVGGLSRMRGGCKDRATLEGEQVVYEMFRKRAC